MNDASNSGNSPPAYETPEYDLAQEDSEVRGNWEAASMEFREAILGSLQAVPPLIMVIMIFRAVAGIHSLIFYLGFISFAAFLFVFVYEGFDYIQNQFGKFWGQKPAEQADPDLDLLNRFVQQTQLLFQLETEEIPITEYRRKPIFSYFVSTFWSFWVAIGLYLFMIVLTGGLLKLGLIEIVLATVGPKKGEAWIYISAIASDIIGLMLELLHLSDTNLPPRTAATLVLIGFFPGILFMSLARDVAVISEELHRRLLKCMYLSSYFPIQNEFVNLLLLMAVYGIIIYLL